MIFARKECWVCQDTCQDTCLILPGNKAHGWPLLHTQVHWQRVILDEGEPFANIYCVQLYGCLLRCHPARSVGRTAAVECFAPLVSLVYYMCAGHKVGGTTMTNKLQMAVCLHADCRWVMTGTHGGCSAGLHRDSVGGLCQQQICIIWGCMKHGCLQLHAQLLPGQQPQPGCIAAGCAVKRSTALLSPPLLLQARPHPTPLMPG